MQGTASGRNQIQIYTILRQQFLYIVGLFEVDCDLEGKPTIGSTFVGVNLHLEQLVEYFCGFVEDGVVECTPAFLSEFIDYVGFSFLQLNELVLLDVFGVVLKNV
jgi:hypothetical protein